MWLCLICFVVTFHTDFFFVDRSKTVKNEIQNRRKLNKPSHQTEKNKRSNELMALPKTNCSICNKVITVKALKRHIHDKHSNAPKKFSCHCGAYSANRMVQLLDHQRRIHKDPMKNGRPKKNAAHEKRSPFRMRYAIMYNIFRYFFSFSLVFSYM